MVIVTHHITPSSHVFEIKLNSEFVFIKSKVLMTLVDDIAWHEWVTEGDIRFRSMLVLSKFLLFYRQVIQKSIHAHRFPRM